MGITWLYTLTSVIIVSLISLVGVLTLFFNEKILRKILIFLVSFAAGALLGDVFLHLLPEVFIETNAVFQYSVFILLGIILFFLLENIIRWQHCHDLACEEHPHPFGYNVLVGDGLHNFIDGVIIAGSFLVSIPLGIATSLAVIFHEIPQEFGDFAILIQAGFTRKKALFFNFLSALFALLGAIVALIIQSRMEYLSLFIISFTIGGFIYIATADLIPELHRKTATARNILYELLFFILGLVVMALLLLV